MAEISDTAWIPAKYTRLQVGPAPYPSAGPGEIVVRNRAVAINPVDWAKQLLGDLLMGYRFRVGDRVMGCGMLLAPDVNRAAEGAFQLLLPAGVSYEQASVLPLTLCTAAYGLFYPDFLNPDLPIFTIAGGASSMGSNAVQLAVAAGYEVYSTCSAKNFDYVLRLGASRVLDHHGEHWSEEQKSMLRALTAGNGSVEACTRILAQLRKQGGDVQQRIAFAGHPIAFDKLQTWLGMIGVMVLMMLFFGRTALSSWSTGVKAKFVDKKDLNKPGNVVSRVLAQFLSPALAAKQFMSALEAHVVGNLLGAIQRAMDIQAAGVSTSKLLYSCNPSKLLFASDRNLDAFSLTKYSER
ncbi:uncharacterized protein BDV17DRAFT_300307 [Aspergillus undulatus]|uniref:uncharacterized protein n=1 Tax=Aspergillus undulatus TaxID=1810928 RepID=UPI003CCD56E3